MNGQSGAKNDSGRKAGVSASRRFDQERGASGLVSGGRNSKQGIANRGAAEEEGRQRKVVPIRNEGKTTRKTPGELKSWLANSRKFTKGCL